MLTEQWISFATLAGVWALAVLLPGPNFFATAQASTMHSRTNGLYTALGIAVGTAFWAAGSLLGLGVLFRTAGWLYSAVKVAGGLYLIWIGIKTLLFGGQGEDTRPAGTAAPSYGSAFWRGLAVDLSNPKAAAFFASLFAVSIPPDSPLWFKALAVAVVTGIGWAWYSFVAVALSLPRVSSLMTRSRRAVAIMSGAVFTWLGIDLATDH